MSSQEKMNMIPTVLEKTKTWAKEAIDNLVSRAKTYGAKKILFSFEIKCKIKHSQIEHTIEKHTITSSPEDLENEFFKKLSSLYGAQSIEHLKISWQGLDENNKEINNCNGDFYENKLFL